MHHAFLQVHDAIRLETAREHVLTGLQEDRDLNRHVRVIRPFRATHGLEPRWHGLLIREGSHHFCGRATAGQPVDLDVVERLGLVYHANPCPTSGDGVWSIESVVVRANGHHGHYGRTGGVPRLGAAGRGDGGYDQ